VRKCFFFDRDGIINESPGEGKYVKDWNEFKLIPDFVEILRIIRKRGFEAIVVTNQRGIALGVVSRKNVELIHAKLMMLLKSQYGVELLDVFYCPHDEGECNCRKPRPGMLLEAARKYMIELRMSWMVGDEPRDIEAGYKAGCKTILVGNKKNLSSVVPDVWVDSITTLKQNLERIIDDDSRGKLVNKPQIYHKLSVEDL
jgi:D-glycero-D-manno-heptose 1,7-bisphosphate phosphatase